GGCELGRTPVQSFTRRGCWPRCVGDFDGANWGVLLALDTWPRASSKTACPAPDAPKQPSKTLTGDRRRNFSVRLPRNLLSVHVEISCPSAETFVSAYRDFELSADTSSWLNSNQRLSLANSPSLCQLLTSVNPRPWSSEGKSSA